MAKRRKKKQKIRIPITKRLVITLVITVLIIAGLLGFAYVKFPEQTKSALNQIIDIFLGDGTDDSDEPSNTIRPEPSTEGVVLDDLQIHFMTLGNDKAGDSIYIKAGDNDIVIDAGSDTTSLPTLKSYIDTYCTDKKLEYVILTHGDKDHVAGFTNTAKEQGLLTYYSVDTIIDNKNSVKTTGVYNEYKEIRDNLVSSGKTKHYTADECWNNKGDAKREFVLSDTVSMKIIYNYFYFDVDPKVVGDEDENNYSVCTMFTYKKDDVEKNFLLTGDLEKEGEELLAEYYDGSKPEKTLPEVELFKAGHHGSKTSSNDCLLKIIKPKMCVVSCCCGTDEYTGIQDNTFPTQEFINRISKYTDAVYVTSIFESYEILTVGVDVTKKTGLKEGDQYIKTEGFKPLNGNIIVSAGINSETSLSDVAIAASNNLTKLKDTEWFNMTIVLNGKERKMRIWPEG